jgi:hypothetical protein
MTIIGETYQVDGTTQNAYCRSKRLILASDCYELPCTPPVCIEEENYLQYYSYSSGTRGIMGFSKYMAASHFLCEEP